MCLYFCGNDFSQYHPIVAQLAEKHCPLVEAGFTGYADWKDKARQALLKEHSKPQFFIQQETKKPWVPTLMPKDRDYHALYGHLDLDPPVCAKCGRRVVVKMRLESDMALYTVERCDDSGKVCQTPGTFENRYLYHEELMGWPLEKIAEYLWRPWLG